MRCGRLASRKGHAAEALVIPRPGRGRASCVCAHVFVGVRLSAGGPFAYLSVPRRRTCRLRGRPRQGHATGASTRARSQASSWLPLSCTPDLGRLGEHGAVFVRALEVRHALDRPVVLAHGCVELHPDPFLPVLAHGPEETDRPGHVVPGPVFFFGRFRVSSETPLTCKLPKNAAATTLTLTCDHSARVPHRDSKDQARVLPPLVRGPPRTSPPTTSLLPASCPSLHTCPFLRFRP